MKRRIIVFALLASMLFTLTACGKTDDAADDSGVVLGEYKGLEVTLLDLSVTDQDVLIEMYDSLRITSYNVCYTKLLRLNATPSRSPSKSMFTTS